MLSSSRFSAVSAVLFTVFALTHSGAATMQPIDNNAVTLLKLADADYFHLDEARESRIQLALIAMDDFEGTVIGAPGKVDVGSQERLPLLWATRKSNLRKWKVVDERNSTVVVSDLGSGRVTLHDAFGGPKRLNYHSLPTSAAGSPGAVRSPRGASVSTNMLQLKELANLPWQPGRYAITILMHDWASNTVVLNLVRNGTGVGEEAAQAPRISPAKALVVQEKVRGMARAASPAITFSRSDSTPALHGEGIVLAAPERHSLAGRRALVHGAARLHLAPGNIVEAHSAAPQAIVRLAMLVCRIDEPIPRKIDLDIPVETTVRPPKAGDPVTVAFNVDIENALRTRLAPATYQIYVVGNEYLAGPLPLTIGAGAEP